MNFVDWCLDEYEDLTIITFILVGLLILGSWILALIVYPFYAIVILFLVLGIIYTNLYNQYRAEQERNDE